MFGAGMVPPLAVAPKTRGIQHIDTLHGLLVKVKWNLLFPLSGQSREDDSQSAAARPSWAALPSVIDFFFFFLNGCSIAECVHAEANAFNLFFFFE